MMREALLADDHIGPRRRYCSPTTRWSPTFDRPLPSLPLRSVAVKRGSSLSLGLASIHTRESTCLIMSSSESATMRKVKASS